MHYLKLPTDTQIRCHQLRQGCVGFFNVSPKHRQRKYSAQLKPDRLTKKEANWFTLAQRTRHKFKKPKRDDQSVRQLHLHNGPNQTSTKIIKTKHQRENMDARLRRNPFVPSKLKCQGAGWLRGSKLKLLNAKAQHAYEAQSWKWKLTMPHKRRTKKLSNALLPK